MGVVWGGGDSGLGVVVCGDVGVTGRSGIRESEVGCLLDRGERPDPFPLKQGRIGNWFVSSHSPSYIV